MQSMFVIRRKYCHLFVFFIGLAFSVLAHAAPPSFTMAFSTSTIGPGGISTLTYTIDNTAEASAVTGLSFSNTLPAGMTIANPNRASTDCVNGVFTATAGGSSVNFSEYRLSSGESCTLTLDVTSATPGTHVNTSGSLATSAGSAGTSNASLIIDAGRAGFSTAFSPSTINQGAVSTLIYTIDNSLNGSNVDLLQFTNTLPFGVVIADQPDDSTTCTGGIFTPRVTTVAAGTSFAIDRAFVAAGATCTVSVNVTAANTGEYSHVTGALSQNGSNPSGVSSALLTVVNPFLNANFPASVAPGTSVTLSYTLSNLDRNNSATDITFTNDLNATLSGLTASVLPASDFCGSGSTISGTSTITIAGANLASGASCSFDLTVLIPSNAAAGTYTNSTSIVNLNLGTATTKPALSHSLVVKNAPLLAMSFIDNPVNAGDSVTLRFTVTNTDTVNGLSDINFTQETNTVYSGMTVSTLPNANSCGTGSTFTSSSPDGSINFFTLAGGSLVAGANCSFDVILNLPSLGSSGSFLHSTSAITGTLSGATVTGNVASDTLVVLAAPSLSIDIVGDSALPGEIVSAEFTLTYSENATADVSNVGFTVDLDSALTGMTSASASSSDICGIGSSISGTSTLSFAAGSLAAGEQCSFIVPLQIPVGATPQTYTLLSSAVTATSAAQMVSSGAVSDSQILTGLSLSKMFLLNNILPGDQVSVRYTISNAATSPAATDIQFTDRLSSSLSSLAAISLPSAPCGAGSTITGSTTLTFSAGNLQPGESCTFDVSVLVPAGASAGSYNSVTSDISATVGGSNTATPNAGDVLYVETLETLITASVSNPTFTSPIPVNINFARSVVNFIESDLVITNGSASNFSGSGLDYSVDITPNTAGTVVITLPINSVEDAVNAGVQNAAASLSVLYSEAPSNVAVTLPATAVSFTGVSYPIEGTHVINASRVFLYADIDNNGVADDSTILASDIVVDNRWTMTATLAPQVSNNFVVVWEDRVNGVNRPTNVPTITETTPNFTPVISGTPATSVAEDSSYSFTPTMTDANTNDTHLYSIVNLPGWASFSAATGALTGTPVNTDVGTTSNIVITVTDSSGLSASLAAFNVSVSNTNDAPVISGTPNTSIAEDAAYSFIPSVNDVDVGDTSTYSVSNMPSWATFSNSSGELSGTPTNDDIGVYSNIVITVTDGSSVADSLPAFNITVSNTNDAPVISGTPNTSVAEDAAYSFIPNVNDVDPVDTATFSITNKPSWASFSTSTGALTGTPTNDDVGATTGIVISVSDAASAMNSLAAFSVSVSNTNDALVISGTPNTLIAQGSSYSFTPTVTDEDVGDSASFSIANQPGWTSFDTTSGALTGLPGNSDVGTYSNILISATDSGGAISNLTAFIITVSNTNDAPVISGTPNTTVAEDAVYSFTPSVNDVDTGDTQTFSISNMPSWAAFSVSTGEISGTPTNDDIGIFSNIVITVTDGSSASDSLPAFNITVSNTNDAPVISGTPNITVAENAAYSFIPSVNDVDVGDILTFSINNQPSWAAFDSGTGELSGTPSNADIASYNNILMSVSDGAISANLAAFTITVFADLDGDNISDDIDLDIDGDGMSNDFETANGLDPRDASDATSDLDGDGISNLDEFTNQSDPTVDDYSPVITLDSFVTIDAVALITTLPAGLVTAADDLDGAVAVTNDLTSQSLAPGRYTINWRAEDAAGNVATEAQTLDILPLANWQVDQEVSEGNTVTVSIFLNGAAPEYPVTANYSVSGTAINPDDHDAHTGSLTITQGRRSSIMFDVLSDANLESDETVIFELDSITNAVGGGKQTHVVTIGEMNHSPKVVLSAVLDNAPAQKINLFTTADGVATITATVTDVDQGDIHSLEWVDKNGLNGTISGSTYSFDPSVVGKGVYQLTVVASDDDATNPLYGSAVITLTIREESIVLSNTTDSDNDGTDDQTEGFGDRDEDNVPDFADSVDESNLLAIYPIGGEPTAGAWFVETEPSLSIKLNLLSSGTANYSPLLVSESIVDENDTDQSDNGYTYDSGIFDFIVTNMPISGQSVNIVIPQIAAIPENGVYRKLINGLWTDYVEDANNSVSSSAGEAGVCPPPGSSEYTNGLTEGDYCVQLKIEDGGANDADGEANGTILDPGGVGQAVSVNVRSSGGAMPWSLLLILSAMMLVLRRYQHIRIVVGK